jgi:hypothetical protein
LFVGSENDGYSPVAATVHRPASIQSFIGVEEPVVHHFYPGRCAKRARSPRPCPPSSPSPSLSIIHASDNDFVIGTGAPIINNEELNQQQQKKICCSECQILGHNATNCRKKHVDTTTQLFFRRSPKMSLVSAISATGTK